MDLQMENSGLPDNYEETVRQLLPPPHQARVPEATSASLPTTFARQTDQTFAGQFVTPSDVMYRLLVQGVTDYSIFMLDTEGVVSSWNAGAERAKGYKAEEIVGHHFSRFYREEDRRSGLPQRALATALKEGKFEAEGWRLRRDGSCFWAHVVIDPIRDESGALIGFAKITRDLTEQKRHADQVRRATETLDSALTNMSQGLCLFGKDERLILCNDRFREMLNIDEPVHPGIKFGGLLERLYAGHHTEHTDPVEMATHAYAEHFLTMGRSGGTFTTEMTRGTQVISFSHRALQDGGWVTTTEDITLRRLHEARITHLALYDPLTLLPNRATFCQRLEEALGGSGAAVRVALLYLDLDGFKAINDTLGHPAGDAVLKVAAERIQKHLRTHDLASRLGGDEFAVLLVDCDELRAASVADRLIREVGSPVVIDGRKVSVGASAGIALAAQHGHDPDSLMRHADLALYRAKHAGRGCHRSYEPGMELAIQERRKLERDIRAALNNSEFILHYQPMVDGVRGAITGFEGLLRWESPSRGRVSPNDFIPIAEETGLMPEIGDWVLRTACREAARWPFGLRLSVNLSAKQLSLPDLVATVSTILLATGLDAERLELEITETAMIDDVSSAASTLRQLRGLGVEIALDDFGTGYSSLSLVSNLPFTRIKIDRSFVRGFGSKAESKAVVRAVIGLCRSLGVSVIAEGVETEQQRDQLLAEGCHELQGFLIGEPIPANEVMAWIAAFPSVAGRRDHQSEAVARPVRARRDVGDRLRRTLRRV